LEDKKNVTIAVFHLVNIDISMPRDASGRRKLGDFGIGAGGSIGYLTRTENGRLVYKRGVHVHLEIYNGRHTSLPKPGKKPHTKFNAIFP
jgi:hypothetical protein